MPPKKNKDDGAQNNAAKITMLDFEAKRLQMRIVEEQMRADRSKTQEMQLQQKYLGLEKDFRSEKEKLYNISTDMNRQYKQMQDELLKDMWRIYMSRNHVGETFYYLLPPKRLLNNLLAEKLNDLEFLFFFYIFIFEYTNYLDQELPNQKFKQLIDSPTYKSSNNIATVEKSSFSQHFRITSQKNSPQTQAKKINMIRNHQLFIDVVKNSERQQNDIVCPYSPQVQKSHQQLMVI